MDVKSWRVRTYRFSHSRGRGIWLLWWALFCGILVFYLVLLAVRIRAPHAVLPTRLFYASSAAVAVVLIALLPLLLFSGLFDTRFRYLAWWIARGAGILRQWVLTGWRSAFLLLAGVGLATWGFYELTDKGFAKKAHDPSAWLSGPFVLKVIALALLVRIVFWAYQTRSRLVILPFINYASGDTIKTSVDGIATWLFSELAGLAQLYSTIDDMTPKAGEGEEKIAQASVQVQDVGTVLQGMISGESKVKLGPLEVPIGALLGAVGRIVQGPRISGSLHRDGAGMTMIASLTGGGRSGNWRVRSEDLDGQTTIDDSTLRSMIEQMAYRIFTELVQTGSSRWRAVRCHSQGLRFYRDQLKTQKGRVLSLRRSERAFIQALAEDNDFAQNHYNLGIVYRERDSDGSETELQEAIAKNRGFVAAYYALATAESDALERMRLCEQVIALQPDHVEAWSLKGAMQRPRAGSAEWEKIIESRAIAAALSWRLMCSTAWTGAPQGRLRALAERCLFNLAVAHTRAGKKASTTASMFRQALYLDPTDARIHFELGKLLESCKKYGKAASAYLAAVRLQGQARPSRLAKQYWTQLAKVLIILCDPARKEKEKEREKYREEAIRVFRVARDRSLVDRKILEDLAKACDAPKDGESDEERESNRERAYKKLELARKYASDASEAKAEQHSEDAARKFAKAHKNFEAASQELGEEEIRSEGLYYEWAQCYQNEGNLEQALQQARNAVDLEPVSATGHKLLGGIYHALGDYERAEFEWQVCLDIEPDDLESLKGIAYTYWERGVLVRCPEDRRQAFTRVIEIFNQTLELSEDWETRAWTHYWLARFHADLMHYDKAFYHFNAAKSRGFKPLETRVQLGLNYLEANAFGEAEDALHEALAEVKKHRVGGGKLNGTLQVDGQDVGEEQTVSDLLVQAYLGLAMGYAERRVNLQRASRLVRKAGRLIKQAEQTYRESYRSYQHECLGLIHLHNGKIDPAILELKKAVAIKGAGLLDDGGAYYHLALAHLAQALSSAADQAQYLTQARERCLDARLASVRKVYQQEIADLLCKLDALEAKLGPPHPFLNPGPGQKAA